MAPDVELDSILRWWESSRLETRSHSCLVLSCVQADNDDESMTMTIERASLFWFSVENGPMALLFLRLWQRQTDGVPFWKLFGVHHNNWLCKLALSRSRTHGQTQTQASRQPVAVANPSVRVYYIVHDIKVLVTCIISFLTRYRNSLVSHEGRKEERKISSFGHRRHIHFPFQLPSNSSALNLQQFVCLFSFFIKKKLRRISKECCRVPADCSYHSIAMSWVGKSVIRRMRHSSLPYYSSGREEEGVKKEEEEEEEKRGRKEGHKFGQVAFDSVCVCSCGANSIYLLSTSTSMPVDRNRP